MNLLPETQAKTFHRCQVLRWLFVATLVNVALFFVLAHFLVRLHGVD